MSLNNQPANQPLCLVNAFSEVIYPYNAVSNQTADRLLKSKIDRGDKRKSWWKSYRK